MYSKEQNKYYRDRRNSDPVFREYHKVKNRESYLRNKEKRDKRVKEYQMQAKIDVMNHYSSGANKCKCCSVSGLPFLTLDHIEGDGAEKRSSKQHVKGTMLYIWLRKNNYPNGFQVLCYNCNQAKRQSPECPHRLLN